MNVHDVNKLSEPAYENCKQSQPRWGEKSITANAQLYLLFMQ